MSLSQWLALDKLAHLFRIIRKNGGIIGSVSKLWRTEELKEGDLMGEDAFGNKYFENKRYMIGTSRWVEFNPNFNWDYDATQVTPEWFGWLHYKTDQVPCEDVAKQCLFNCRWSQRWLLPPTENHTGTACAYYPYSTTPPKVQAWDGCSFGARKC